MRLDPETLHARISIPDCPLVPTYLWCMSDDNKVPSAWRLTELRPVDDWLDSPAWHDDINSADVDFKSRPKPHFEHTNGNPTHIEEEDDDDTDDDGAYWAAYDMTPGRTPHKRSPAPMTHSNTLPVNPPSKSEMEYFERYLTEVQPAADPYDASEDVANHQSHAALHNNRTEWDESYKLNANGNGIESEAKDSAQLVISVPGSPHQPQPSSSASPRSVAALQEQAESQSQAEVGIKQHISTDIKSLYRLARSAGISLEEFDRIVRTELEVLPMLDMA